MKEIFKTMQKSNFKKVKAMTSSPAQEQPKPQKGFVKECLVKVELQKECEGQVKDMLKVNTSHGLNHMVDVTWFKSHG